MHHAVAETGRRIGPVAEHVVQIGVLGVVAVERHRSIGRGNERKVFKELPETAHRPRETDLRSPRERRAKSVALEAFTKCEHVGMTDAPDAAVAHGLHEMVAHLDGDRLVALLKVERIPSRARTHVEQRAIDPRGDELAAVVPGSEIAEIERLDGMLARPLAVALNEGFVLLAPMEVTDGAAERVGHGLSDIP